MKKTLFLLLFFLSIQLFSQIEIKGQVTSITDQPLAHVSVYLNNTTIGTSTKLDGRFKFQIDHGIYELIVSSLGYKTIHYPLITSKYNKSLTFKLSVEENVLSEVEIKKTRYNDEWKFNLNQFTTNFLGKTNLSKQCEIINPKVLHFEFDKKTATLTATARAPLQIKHIGLGYHITFDLEQFTLSQNRVHYLGFTKYKNLNGSKRKRKRWQKNRLKAYYGSKMHFVRSLINGTTKKEGFTIHFFRRELNPKRPTEEEINNARKIVQFSGINAVDFSKKITNPITKTDSSIVILQKISLPKHIDYLYKQNVNQSEIVTKLGDKTQMSFKNHISIIYSNEAEEDNFVMGPFGKRRQPLQVQTSSLIMFTKQVNLEKSGTISNPLDVFNEGYWAYEQFADALPLDFQPTN